MNETKNNMKTYKVISSKDQGVYSKGELIRTIKSNNIAEYYGLENNKFFSINNITSDNANQVNITE